MIVLEEIAIELAGKGMRKRSNAEKTSSFSTNSEAGQLDFRYHVDHYLTLAVLKDHNPRAYFQFKFPQRAHQGEQEVFRSSAYDLDDGDYLRELGFKVPSENMALYTIQDERRNGFGSLVLQLALKLLEREKELWSVEAVREFPVFMNIKIIDERFLDFYRSMGLQPDPLKGGGRRSVWQVKILVPPYEIRDVQLKP